MIIIYLVLFHNIYVFILRRVVRKNTHRERESRRNKISNTTHSILSAFLRTITARPQMNLLVADTAESSSSIVSICFWKGKPLSSKQTNRMYGRALAYAFPAIAGSIRLN